MDATKEPTASDFRIWTQTACSMYAEQALRITVDPMELKQHNCEELQQSHKLLAPELRERLYKTRRDLMDQLFRETVYNFQDSYDPESGDWRLFSSYMEYSHDSARLTVVARAVMTSSRTIAIEDVLEQLTDRCQQSPQVTHIQHTNELVISMPYVSCCSHRVVPFAVYNLAPTYGFAGDNNNNNATAPPQIHVCPLQLNCSLRLVPVGGARSFSDAIAGHRGMLVYSVEHNAYVCERSGVGHLCGDWCNLLETTRDGHFCKRTGMSVALQTHTTEGMASTTSTTARFMRAEEVHWTQWRHNRRAKNSDALSNMTVDEFIYTDIANTTSLSHLLAGGASETYSMRHHIVSMNFVLMYVAIAQRKLAALLSEERITTEAHQYTTKVRKHMSEQLDRLVSHSAQRKRPLDLMMAATLVANERNRREQATEVALLAPGALDAQARFALISKHASNCVLLWWIVLTQTRYGRERPFEFRFHPFVLAAILLFESGLVVSDKQLAQSVTIIESDAVLQMFKLAGAINAYEYRNRRNSSAAAAAAPLRFTAIGGNNNGSTTTSNNSIGRTRINTVTVENMSRAISTAISNAIVNERVAPEALRAHNYAVNDLDVSEFHRLVQVTTMPKRSTTPAASRK
jgi:hypothetical protein